MVARLEPWVACSRHGWLRSTARYQARVAPLNGAMSGTGGSAQRHDVRHGWLRSTARYQARLAPLNGAMSGTSGSAVATACARIEARVGWPRHVWLRSAA